MKAEEENNNLTVLNYDLENNNLMTVFVCTFQTVELLIMK